MALLGTLKMSDLSPQNVNRCRLVEYHSKLSRAVAFSAGGDGGRRSPELSAGATANKPSVLHRGSFVFVAYLINVVLRHGFI